MKIFKLLGNSKNLPRDRRLGIMWMTYSSENQVLMIYLWRYAIELKF